MLKNNKGDVTIILVIILILTLVLLVALLYPQYNIFIKIGGKAQYDICRNSVDAASLMRFKNIELSPFLKCETQQYTITKNNVDDAKQTIADAMYYCYYQFAQGEKNLFSDEGRFCFVCSTIDFEESGTKINELPAFQKYLFENYADSKHTYAQYLYKDNTEQIKKNMGESYYAALPKQKMAALFVYNKFKSARLKEIEQQNLLFAQAILPLLPPPFNFLASSEITLGTIYGAKYFGEYGYGGKVELINNYSQEAINKLECTQKIPQKNK